MKLMSIARILSVAIMINGATVWIAAQQPAAAPGADHRVGGKADQDAALQDRVEAVGEAHGSKSAAQRPDQLARSGR
jgi:hypothetical protein